MKDFEIKATAENTLTNETVTYTFWGYWNERKQSFNLYHTTNSHLAYIGEVLTQREAADKAQEMINKWLGEYGQNIAIA